MDVKFITTTSGQLDEIQIVNGQIIALSDINAYFYDMGDMRRPASAQVKVSTLPETGVEGIWYTCLDENQPGIFVWDNSTFVKIADAVTLDSAAEIKYDNTTSGLQSEHVQAALDEIDKNLDTFEDDLRDVQQYVSQLSETTEDELLSVLLEEDIVNPASVDGSILFTDNVDAVYTL